MGFLGRFGKFGLDFAKAFFSPAKLIGMGAALVIALGAAYLGMDSKEVKAAICGAPTVELPPAAPTPGAVAK